MLTFRIDELQYLIQILTYGLTRFKEQHLEDFDGHLVIFIKVVLPLSSESIWSCVKDVRFLCSFRFKRMRISSGSASVRVLPESTSGTAASGNVKWTILIKVVFYNKA